MAKVLNCEAIVVGCEYIGVGASEEEVLQKVVDHVEREHRIKVVTPEIIDSARAAIYDE